MALLLFDPWQELECPNCHLAERVRPLPPNSQRFHQCPALHGLTAPMILKGTDCKVVAREREDYLRGERQETGDDGKPYMAVETIHADGHNDVAVFPGVAVTGVRQP